MSLAVLMGQILVIFLEIGVGFAAAKAGVLGPGAGKTLSGVIMSVTLPCTLLASTNLPAGGDTILRMVKAALLLEIFFVLSAVACLWVARRLGCTPGQKAVLVTLTVLPNSTFIGLPLASAILGPETGMLYVAAGMVAFNLFFFTYATQLFQPGQKPALKSFITPANLATVAMVVMLLLGLHLAGPLQSFVADVGGCTTPLALMVVGAMLAESDLAALFKTPLLYGMTLLRCVVFPLGLMLVLHLAGVEDGLAMGVVILAACPCGSLGAVLAKQQELEAELASQAVAQSTLASAITIPVLLMGAGVLFGI
ncbi:MAG: AEC family transporter [Gemmiger sp.]|nr:AEC family transporter [Gemmiger sp.]